MTTVLSMLYPHGYTVRESPGAGSIDVFGILAPEEDEPTPCDGIVSAGDTLFVSGWAIDPHFRELAAGVIVTFGAACIEAEYGHERMDVGKSLGNGELAACGFRGAVAPHFDETGRRELRVLAVGIDGRSVFPVGTKSVSIVAGSVALDMQDAAGAEFASYHITSGRGGQVRRGDPFEVAGFAQDRDAGGPVRGVFLVVDGVNVVYGAIGNSRLPAAHGVLEGAHVPSGFKIRFDTTGLAMGSHRLRLGFINANGAAVQTVELAERLDVLSPLARKS